MIRVLYAAGDEAERAAVAAIRYADLEISFPAGVPEIEARIAAGTADVIVTDFSFAAGGFADWLSLWPLPAVLLVNPGADPARAASAVRDESSVFLVRDPAGEWLRYLPAQIRKIRNMRESITRHNAFLSITERQYLNLLQAIPDIVYMLDGNGNFLYLNESIRSLGWEPSKLLGQHFSRIVHPDDVPNISKEFVLDRFTGTVTGPEQAPKLFDERRSGSRMTRNLEVRLVHGSQSADPFLGSVNAYGEVSSTGMELPEYENLRVGTVGIIRDITHRKEHQRKLESDLEAKEILLKYVLNNRALWVIAIANAFIYFVRYGVLDWAPTYLSEVKGFQFSGSSWAYALYEWAGIPGTIACGYISDKMFQGRRAPTVILFMAATAVCLVVYWLNPPGNPRLDVAMLIAIGFLIYGPVMLIGVFALDLVPKKAAGTSAGFTGLFGYVGGSLAASVVIGFVADRFHWDAAFLLILAACVVTIILTALTIGAEKRAGQQVSGDSTNAGSN